MSGTITLTAAMRANLLSLQQTGAELSTTQLDLATGNKVNSALDNPVNYFAAQALNTRASSLSTLLDGMGQAVTAIQTANEGITAITTLVNQLTSIVNSASQDLATQITQNILASVGGTEGISSAIVNNLTSGISNGKTITGGDTLILASALGAGDSITVTTGESLNAFVAQINTSSQFTASIVYGNGTTVSPAGGTELNGDAYLSIVATDGSVVTATNDSHNQATGNLIVSLDLLISGSALTAATSAAVSTGGSSGDNTNFQNVLAQINALASNTTYGATSLINGINNNLVVQVNELSTTPLTVASVNSTTTGLGLTVGGINDNVTTSAGITTSTSAIQSALNTLKTQAASFAQTLSLLQTRQDFTTNLVNTLQNGSSLLTIADKNEEGANLLALQTQQQLGIEALSLTSQSNQSVLRLFA